MKGAVKAMQLSSSIIVNRLSSQFFYDLIGKVDGDLSLSRPVFLTEKTTPRDGCVLVGRIRKNKDIPQKRVHSLFLTQGHLLEELKDKFDCILCFRDDIDLNEVINYIQSVFSIYDDWQQDLANLSRLGASLTELLDRSQIIFTNPLLIHNKDFEFIAYSSLIDVSPKLSFLIESRHTSDAQNNFMIDKEFQTTFNTKDAQIFPAHLTGIRTVYKNIFSHDKLLCRILAAETNRNIQSSDPALMDILADYIKYVLEKDHPPEDTLIRTLNNTLQRMLSGEQIEDYIVLKTLSNYGWKPDCEYICLKFLVDHIDVQNHSAIAMVDYLEQMIKGSCAFEFKNDIVLFINLTLYSRPFEEALHELRPFIRDRNLKAGISSPYHGFSWCFQMMYRQAEIALDVGLRFTPYKWIHQYKEVSDIYLLERCISELPANMVCSPEIVAIYKYDNSHHSEYFHTLKTYLNNNMQPVATAKELFIHRTTFLYRLNKMQEKFHLKLDNPQKRLMYQLSIALLEQAHHTAI